MADLTPDQLRAKLAELSAQSVDDQARFFLRAFVLDFRGNFEEVLALTDEFVKYASPGDEVVKELDEFQAHLFLERRGETLTVVKLREYLRDIDLDFNKKVSFIEYVLWKYQKTLPQLFTPPPGGVANAALLRALDEAISQYQAARAAQRQREEEMQRLEQAAQAPRSVASVQAANKRDELAGQEFAQKFAELQALKAKKAAQKALDEAPRIDPFEEEQKRLAEEARLKEEAEKRAKEEARARLKARAALWQ